MRARCSILGVVTVLLLAACGGDVGDGQGTGGGEGEATRDAGSVTIAAVWTGTEEDRFTDVLDDFTEETGIPVRYQNAIEMGTYLGTQLEGGSPPDVAMIPQPGLIQDLVTRDALEPIGEEAAQNLEDNYAPVWTELGTFDDTLYAVYFKAANKSTWWYNTSVLDSAAVEPPGTWEEMLDAAKTVTASGNTWVSIGGADGWVLTDWFENIYLQMAGPEMYERLAEHEIPWTHPSVIKALNIFGELLKNERYLVGGRDGVLETDFVTSVTQVYADPPEGATVYEGDFVAGVIAGETDAEVGTDADFFPFPRIEESLPSVMGGGDAAVVLTDNPAAQRLVAYLATPKAAEIWASQGGFTSPNEELDLSVYPSDISRRIAEAIVGAETFRFDLSDLQPAEFGATTGRGMYLRMQQFVQSVNAKKVARSLERDADIAYQG